NLTCIPLWFLVNHLTRTQAVERQRLTTFLALLKDLPIWKSGKEKELRQAVADLRGHLDRADELGSLWGRKHTTLAKLEFARICDRYPDEVEGVLERLSLPSRRDGSRKG
ncbi:MAG: hypothetical protein VX498_13855, partial [Myxococcota bacterium]|nr:hypothetical protein [Myxococcota bacterium]